MIQRIQSVYLLGAFILLELAASLLYVMPEIMLGGYRLIVVVVLALCGLGGFGAIFLFGRRDQQVKIVRLLVVTNVVVVLAFLGAAYAMGDMAMIIASRAYSAIVGVFLAPLVALLLLHGARKAIQRDIDLIRSMDRLR